MANPSILLKLNQSFSNTINTTPNDWYNAILLQMNEWLAIFPNFFHSLSLKLHQILSTLAQWLAIFPNFLHSLSLKLHQLLSTLGQWLALAAPYIFASLAVILICLLSYFLLPCIISLIFSVLSGIWFLISRVLFGIWFLISRVLSGIWFLIRGFFELLWKIISGFFRMVLYMCKSIWGICGWCGRGSVKMMKAPGTAGKVIMPRAIFEANPKLYFSGFRASSRLLV